jgi:hypothetical protein
MEIMKIGGILLLAGLALWIVKSVFVWWRERQDAKKWWGQYEAETNAWDKRRELESSHESEDNARSDENSEAHTAGSGPRFLDGAKCQPWWPRHRTTSRNLPTIPSVRSSADVRTRTAAVKLTQRISRPFDAAPPSREGQSGRTGRQKWHCTCCVRP